jgi:hypothetical protein
MMMYRYFRNADCRCIEYFHAKDKVPQVCYVFFTIKEESSIPNKDVIQVGFIRFDYDVEKAAKAVEKTLLPN